MKLTMKLPQRRNILAGILLVCILVVGWGGYQRYGAPQTTKVEAELDRFQSFELSSSRLSLSANASDFAIKPHSQEPVAFYIYPDEDRFAERFQSVRVTNASNDNYIYSISAPNLTLILSGQAIGIHSDLGASIKLDSITSAKPESLFGSDTIGLTGTGAFLTLQGKSRITSGDVMHGDWRGLSNLSLTIKRNDATLFKLTNQKSLVDVTLNSPSYWYLIPIETLNPLDVSIVNWKKVNFRSPLSYGSRDKDSLTVSSAKGTLSSAVGRTILSGIETITLKGSLEDFELDSNGKIFLRGTASEIRVDTKEMAHPSFTSDVISNLALVSTLLSLVGLAGGAPTIYRTFFRPTPTLKIEETPIIRQETSDNHWITFTIVNRPLSWQPPKAASFLKYSYAIYDSSTTQLVFSQAEDSSDILAPEKKVTKSLKVTAPLFRSSRYDITIAISCVETEASFTFENVSISP